MRVCIACSSQNIKRYSNRRLHRNENLLEFENNSTPSTRHRVSHGVGRKLPPKQPRQIYSPSSVHREESFRHAVMLYSRIQVGR